MVRKGRKKRALRHLLRRPAASLLVFLLVAITGGVELSREYPEPVPLRTTGLVGDHSALDSVERVSPDAAKGASYIPGSDVIQLSGGRLLYFSSEKGEVVQVPLGDPGAMSAVSSSRRWLQRGTVPGETPKERRMAARALLNLHLLTRPNGAAVAAWYPRWKSVWPRDASWTSVAFSTTSHHHEAYKILRFLATVQKGDGTWEARYGIDGEPVLDGRPPQLDATGWFPWAAWYWHTTAPPSVKGEIHELWPAVRRAADEAAGSLGADGLPPAGADYWEMETPKPNLGTAAPLRAGLRASADLARRLGHDRAALRYTLAAARLDRAIEKELSPHGYPRTTSPASGADAAVNFLAQPFAPADPGVEAATRSAAERLTAPNGGTLPGERWPQDPTVSWTPETALFAISAAARGDREATDHWLGWLAEHRTGLGAFPEKIDGEGEPKSVAPIGWTEAIVVLTLAAGDKKLPVPPVPEPGTDEITRVEPLPASPEPPLQSRTAASTPEARR